jgi:riboflavin synthase alpha subunit
VFTGIVRELGRVTAVDGGPAGIQLKLEAPRTASAVSVRDSVAIDGCCLTVTSVNGSTLTFDAVPETLDRTTLGSLAAGAAVNLEPALRAGEPLGGHYVQGHVDSVGRIRSVEPEGDGKRIWFDAPAAVLRYCVEKGSIAVQGASLTVAALDEGGFAVALIPHTLAETTLGAVARGDQVNLEVDVLAKYVERLLTTRGR